MFQRRAEHTGIRPWWLPIAFGLGAVVATAGHLASDVNASHQLTLPPAAGSIIKPGGPGRGDAPEEWQPPSKYQRDTFVGVQFGSAATVRADCGRTSSGGWAAACEQRDGTRIPLLVVPNPCGRAEAYALMLCHEIGHAEGWELWHGGGHFARRADIYAVRLDGTDRLGRRLAWATTVEASSKRDAEAKAQRKLRRFDPGFRTSRLAAFN
jgi:hypothetical protein